MNTIKQTYVIAATPEEVWRALTDPAIIREWSGAAAHYPLEVGAPYSLWDGDIVGEIVEIAPGERLIQTWKPTDWTRQDSVVRFTLVPEEGTTLVDLVHENVEESDYEGTTEGWDIYYLGAIKRMLEEHKAKPQARAMARRPVKSAKVKAVGKSAAKNKTRAKPTAKKRAKPQGKRMTQRSAKTSAKRKR